MHPDVSLLNPCMRALGQSDYATVKSLLAPGGKVVSPFLGEMLAGPFFDRRAGASTNKLITPIDVFPSATDKHLATAHFQYDWTLCGGTLISFKVMDLFSFDPASARVTGLDLICSTRSRKPSPTASTSARHPRGAPKRRSSCTSSCPSLARRQA